MRSASRGFAGLATALAAFTAAAFPDKVMAETGPCRKETATQLSYTVCRFYVTRDRIQLFHANSDGKAFGDFRTLRDALAKRGEMLVFAMNAGMYHDDRTPVGLHVEDGKVLSKLNTTWGFGNFFLKPNGVLVLRNGRAEIVETPEFSKAADGVQYATQSGPMLVIKGQIHQGFLANSPWRNIRNGVGVDANGTSVAFAISESPVTFHEFATLFRDTLKMPNALYLDGSISRLYAPNLGREDAGEKMGPIVGVVVAKP